ncbi:MAG: TldD/PmbA family protein [Deltaproteobacteria bacterium]|nr:TldD/PmbA family protein [Deltaproteobacteria bacterium]
MTAERITVELIDQIKPAVFELATGYARRLRECRYADIRVEVGEGQGASAENGHSKASSSDYGFSFGIRILAGKQVAAPGYFGQSLGLADLPALPKLLREGLRHAHKRALANAERKLKTREQFGPLGESIYSSHLAPVQVCQDVVPAEYQIDPRSVPLDEIVRYTADVSKAVAAVDGQVRYNYTNAFTTLTRILFCSSEGASIDQSFALTQGLLYVVAQSDEATEEIYDYVGHQRGWEVITRGSDEEFIRHPDFRAFALDLAREAVEIARAKPLKATEEEVVVVTDPHFNTLKVHEIVGHPVELDRALKMEAAYAGRTWLLRDLEEHQIGKQVASPLVSAFSDPALPGYGHYTYDDEGVRARRVVHIDRGVFKGFMNSRQTAAILGEEPNGSFKSIDASYVPLIRMSNTVFGPGGTPPGQIIGEVEHGYYVCGHRIPSIAESRENFRISARKVYEVRNGKLGQLFRDGGIMADSRDYLMKVDAVGNDFRLYPIPNCGKGQPMQTKRLGNGGPTMRSRARLTGA